LTLQAGRLSEDLVQPFIDYAADCYQDEDVIVGVTPRPELAKRSWLVAKHNGVDTQPFYPSMGATPKPRACSWDRWCGRYWGNAYSRVDVHGEPILGIRDTLKQRGTVTVSIRGAKGGIALSTEGTMAAANEQDQHARATLRLGANIANAASNKLYGHGVWISEEGYLHLPSLS
jgi:hypothetical protein